MADNKNDPIDWGGSDFIRIRDALIGKTHGDNYRHLVVRIAFLREFWNDVDVQALVSRWAKDTGLEEAALRVASCGKRLAELAGLEHRGELLNREAFTVDEQNVQGFREGIAEYMGLYRAYFERVRILGDTFPSISSEAINFVNVELGLPYPWLAFALLEGFIYAVTGVALGLKFQIDTSYEPTPLSEIEAPMLEISFRTRNLESVEDALSRLGEELGNGAAYLLEPVLPDGKIPDRRLYALEGYARWYCRY
ncbi:MAG: hypothetical protein O2783_01035 [Chloroflexi bacterium]|nr:hypothetical protein [Chloroflexota bacterium]